MALIFQYGSNTSIARLNSETRLNGSARKIGVVYTKNKFNFDFTVWSKGNACAVADIIPNGNTHVWGVLYDIPDNRVFRKKRIEGTKCLDQIEGEGKNYKRVKISVCDTEDEDIVEDVWTYIVTKELRDTSLKTNKEYITHIVNGLQENDIPLNYIEYVKTRILYNNPDINFDKLN